MPRSDTTIGIELLRLASESGQTVTTQLVSGGGAPRRWLVEVLGDDDAPDVSVTATRLLDALEAARIQWETNQRLLREQAAQRAVWTAGVGEA